MPASEYLARIAAVLHGPIDGVVKPTVHQAVSDHADKLSELIRVASSGGVAGRELAEASLKATGSLLVLAALLGEELPVQGEL